MASLRNLVVGALSHAGSSTSPPPYAATPTTHILGEGLEARARRYFSVPARPAS
jgi:hypothetical protein